MIINGAKTKPNNPNLIKDQINVRQKNPKKVKSNIDTISKAQKVALAFLVSLNLIAKAGANNSTSTNEIPDNLGVIIVSCGAGIMVLLGLCLCICDRNDSDEELHSNKQMHIDMQQRNNVLRHPENIV